MLDDEPIVPREIFDVAMRVMNGKVHFALRVSSSPSTPFSTSFVHLLPRPSIGEPVPPEYPSLEQAGMEDDEEEDEEMGSPQQPSAFLRPRSGHLSTRHPPFFQSLFPFPSHSTLFNDKNFFFRSSG